jgi:hypothetical protein
MENRPSLSDQPVQRIPADAKRDDNGLTIIRYRAYRRSTNDLLPVQLCDLPTSGDVHAIVEKLEREIAAQGWTLFQRRDFNGDDLYEGHFLYDALWSHPNDLVDMRIWADSVYISTTAEIE